MKHLTGGGMRALPGPTTPGRGEGRSYGGWAAGGVDVVGQPGLWAIPVAGFILFTLTAWLVDLVTAGWCHYEDRCVPTHYLADLLHAYLIALAVIAGVVVLAVAYVRGWLAAIGWALLVILAWAVRRTREAHAEHGARRRARSTAVTAVVVDADEVVVEAVDVEPRALPAVRVPGIYDGGWSAQPVPPLRDGRDTGR